MYDPNDSRQQWRAQRRYEREMCRNYRYQNPLRGLAGAFVIIALIIAFAFSHVNFLAILFVGLAFASLFGSISTAQRTGVYGGMHGFIWLLGLALCFTIGFWPWILLPVVVSTLLGSFYRPIMGGLAGNSFLGAAQMQPPNAQQPYPPQEQQPYPPQEQPVYQPYQQGYQGPQVPPQPIYQAGPEPKQQFEQPQVQYPEQQQELPPMEQK